jgi:UDP-N-acetylglucosamine/UDP-N-acetylgalactosamine diphosphorylase
MINFDSRLVELQGRGVEIIDPCQTYLGSEIDVERICPGVTLYPGVRLLGSRTFIGPKAKVGSEGPATLVDTVLAGGAEIASGYVEGAVLLTGARLGSNAHVRKGTLLEEYASTAHAVGLKQTILMAFVTAGSLINLCDALISGGRSRMDHSEIGSGFIHFNYTPYGQSGDKATPTLVGDVERGVFLREDRIFLGGMSGVVGPQKIGFGAFTAAGQVIREEVAEGHLFSSVGRAVIKKFDRFGPRGPEKKLGANLQFIGQLFALRAWYSSVRLERLSSLPDAAPERIVVREALCIIEQCIAERIARLNAFLTSVGEEARNIEARFGECPLPIQSMPEPREHLAWLGTLTRQHIAAAELWLHDVAQSVYGKSQRQALDRATPPGG